ncbi:thioredoxin [Magnetococcus marinus MC-1]|uniref:Thioredoxin n=1 Tax=Magnetococcus marinus (strain ATCC BAA-1437 / JCM 17883 / MC-1) TaxID=156889 RepID=A0LDV0_MAGMM|nr:thioredoxin [Magnetococcus marinus]ABK46143.1 thioredoxin [Magnetococcus marinus MC-1]
MSEHVTSTTDSQFETDVLQAETPVLVDFWAEWCGPCKQVAPFLDQLAQDKVGSLKVVKLNIDENPNVPGRFGVRGIPTLMIFKGGQIQASKIGAMPKSKLYEWVDEALAG